MTNITFFTSLLSYLFLTLILSLNLAKAQIDITTTNIGGSSIETALEMAATLDGGYVLVGSSYSQDGDVPSNMGGTDIMVVKLDENGEKKWVKTFGGSGVEYAYSVVPLFDGSILVAGVSSSNDGDFTNNIGSGDNVILKLDENGNLQWIKNYGGSNIERQGYLIPTSEGGFMFACSSESDDGDLTSNKGGGDVWLVKLNSDYEIEWQQSYGGSLGDYIADIIQTSDGNYVALANANSKDGDIKNPKGGEDAWVFKINIAGDIVWERSLGGSKEDQSGGIQEAPNGDIIVAADTYSTDKDIVENKGQKDAFISRLNGENGEIVWTKTYGGSNFESPKDIAPITDDVITICGYGRSGNGDMSGHYGGGDVWVFELNLEDGTFLKDYHFGGSENDTGMGIVLLPNGFAVGGMSASDDIEITNAYGQMDFFFVKYTDASLSVTEEIPSAGQLKVFPNPFADFVQVDLSPLKGNTETLQLEVYESNGQKIFSAFHKGDGKFYVPSFLMIKNNTYLYQLVDKENNNQVLSKGQLLKE